MHIYYGVEILLSDSRALCLIQQRELLVNPIAMSKTETILLGVSHGSISCCFLYAIMLVLL